MKAVKTHMTDLERGLACSARQAGMTVEDIAEALHRDPRTLQHLFKKRGLYFKLKCGRKRKKSKRLATRRTGAGNGLITPKPAMLNVDASPHQ